MSKDGWRLIDIQQVVYIGANDAQVVWGNCDDPRGLLEEGREYEVEETQVHSWHTKLALKGFPGKRFNSVCFVNATQYRKGE